MATGCEQGIIARGGVGAAAVDAPAKESGCLRCVALQQQLEAQRWELVRERCAARSFRSLHERACARERAKHEEVKALRADISGAAALRKEVETLKARLAALSGAERSSPDRLRMKHRALRSRVKELEGEVERLRSLNRQLQQATYGRRSERRCRSQRRGARPAPGEGRSRGQQRGAPGHSRTPRPALPEADIIRLLLLTGCRRGEILALRWNEVDADTIALGDAKTGPRNVYLNAPARCIIERQPRGQSTFVFPSERNPERPYRPHLPLWDRVRTEAGIEDVRLHDLRHTMASHAVMNGVPVPVVSRLLGHSNVRMTLRYAHLADRDIEAAAERVGAAMARAMALQ